MRAYFFFAMGLGALRSFFTFTFASAELSVPHAKAVRVRDAMLALETISVAELAAALHRD